jgi:catechol 2,3-dioxygenase-like lactoylglutathione lyase family enzyme
MKVKSISGVVCYVTDLDQTTAFYEKLGFRFDTKTDDHVKAYINWFWIEFILGSQEQKTGFQKEAQSQNKGAGEFLCLSVDDVDEAYKELVAQGLKPSGEPKSWPWGRREFVIRDPDGYKLVLFQKS